MVNIKSEFEGIRVTVALLANEAGESASLSIKY